MAQENGFVCIRHARLLKLRYLRIHALAVHRNSCIAKNQTEILHRISAQEKPLSINGMGFVQNS